MVSLIQLAWRKAVLTSAPSMYQRFASATVNRSFKVVKKGVEAKVKLLGCQVRCKFFVVHVKVLYAVDFLFHAYNNLVKWKFCFLPDKRLGGDHLKLFFWFINHRKQECEVLF